MCWIVVTCLAPDPVIRIKHVSGTEIIITGVCDAFIRAVAKLDIETSSHKPGSLKESENQGKFETFPQQRTKSSEAIEE